MIQGEGWYMIRELLREGLSVSEIARQTGQQAQVDWASGGRIWHRDRLRSLSSFSMTLGYSRRQYVEFTVSQDMETFLRCHINAFGYFRGIPIEILYDNLT